MNSLFEVREVEASLFVDVEEFEEKNVFGNITTDITGVKISTGSTAIEGHSEEEYKENLLKLFIRMRVFEMRPYLHIQGKISKIINALSYVSAIWKKSELTKRADKRECDPPINSYLCEAKASPCYVPKGQTKVTTTEISGELLTIYEKCMKIESNFQADVSQLKAEIGNMLSKSYIYEGNEDVYSNTETDHYCTELMVIDPFVSAATAMLPKYDGNPIRPFAQWEEEFRDTLNLITNDLTEAQKLNRLKYCLEGRARQEFNKINENTLDNALNQLREQFQGSSSRVIAKQALAGCRQAPGEKVFIFANRLNKAVRAALNEEDENNIQKRLFDEFIERILPDIRFQVKSQMPDTYTKAYELAENFELLLREKDAYVTVCETNEINNCCAQTNNKINGKCRYCGQNNINECQEKKSGSNSFIKPNVRFLEKSRLDVIYIACIIISWMQIIGAENNFDEDPIHKNRRFCFKASDENEVHIWDRWIINPTTIVILLICFIMLIAISFRKYLMCKRKQKVRTIRERDQNRDAFNFGEDPGSAKRNDTGWRQSILSHAPITRTHSYELYRNFGRINTLWSNGWFEMAWS
ncbi:CBR-DCT-10 protein [Ditylenchus destructor]|uniref:CBR-DCT-10 protein n=1 Tax=Ditylenchus destructor TaxID=166010 RepID=A0AAD4N0G3_9BILA|nr:CBR-DCT-10 protein [Ditylenchus destructor]